MTTTPPFPGSWPAPSSFLHIATLVHDDTIDKAALRRGQATISHLWGDHAAVLVGDYLFAKSATFVCATENVRVIRLFSETIMHLSRGELQERIGAYDWTTGREDYYQRIQQKTASLFTTAAESGAILSGAPEETVQRFRTFGHCLGMAFQIVDDILDFQGTESEVGKPVGADLAQGVLTLPALLLQERYPYDDPVKAIFEEPEDEGRLKRGVGDNQQLVGHRGLLRRRHRLLPSRRKRPWPPSRTRRYRRALMELPPYVLVRKS